MVTVCSLFFCVCFLSTVSIHRPPFSLSLCFPHHEAFRVTSPPLSWCRCLCWGLQRQRRRPVDESAGCRADEHGCSLRRRRWKLVRPAAFGEMSEREASLLFNVAMILFLVPRYRCWSPQKITCFLIMCRSRRDAAAAAASPASSHGNTSVFSYLAKFETCDRNLLFPFSCVRTAQRAEPFQRNTLRCESCCSSESFTAG